MNELLTAVTTADPRKVRNLADSLRVLADMVQHSGNAVNIERARRAVQVDLREVMR